MVNGRGKLQGVINILRFNYPMYLLTMSAIVLAASILPFTQGAMQVVIALCAGLAFLQLSISLIASAYAYDYSGLYNLDFLPQSLPAGARILNVTAGFDECSELIVQRYPRAALQAYDFFDPARHTEPSIRRARISYPHAPDTQLVSTDRFPDHNASADMICVILSAHEIRDTAERRRFLAELKRLLKPDGELIVVEHPRNMANLLAYNIGAFHFFSSAQWRSDFLAAGFRICRCDTLTRFIHCYTLTPSDVDPS